MVSPLAQFPWAEKKQKKIKTYVSAYNLAEVGEVSAVALLFLLEPFKGKHGRNGLR